MPHYIERHPAKSPEVSSERDLRSLLRRHLTNARGQTDQLFRMLAPEAMYQRPIPERHRVAFYLGHLEAFDWNLLCKTASGASVNSEFDRLFAFGIDPVDRELPQDRAHDWPRVEEIHSYNGRIRTAVDECLEGMPLTDNGLMLRVAIEHRLMHAETLAYMWHWLAYELKHRVPSLVPPETVPPKSRMAEIPAGTVTLGQNRDGLHFGWDNEFEAHTVFVPEFSMDVLNVTNADYLQFVEAGGYDDRASWDEHGWEWIQKSDIQYPKFWLRRGNHWFYRTMFDEIPLPPAWPVYVSHAEAQAFARWKGKSLPTEAQFHRAAFGLPEGLEQSHPWGEAAPGAEHGNFDFRSWTPLPAGSFPSGRSGFGIMDLIGNGWEWTSTIFEAFKGFEPFSFYPGYSADFFDGKHFVLKGASPRTAALLVRRSFRNWFQPYYPNVYASFRCVEN